MSGSGIVLFVVGSLALAGLLSLGIVAFVIWMLVRTSRIRREQRERARAFAAQRGWTYSESVPFLTRRWAVNPFGRGSSRSAINVLTGTVHGMQLVSFQYSYIVSRGRSSTTYRFHVLALHLPAQLPALQLSPETANPFSFLAGRDIELESEGFNATWRVVGPEGQFPYDFLHPRMMERLMAPDAIGTDIAVSGPDLIVALHGPQQLERIDYYANLLYGIYQLVPKHVWRRVGHDPSVS